MNPQSGSFFLGRFFGINVRVHWTVLLIAVFRLQMLMGMAAMAGHEKASAPVAVGILVGGFLSILLHEFGHSLTCRFFKGDADEILMWPLGGLAFCRPPHHAFAHFMTTFMGPFVTLVIWLVCSYCVPLVLNPATSAIGFTLVILGHWNLFLLLFNLLPGFPMDGGRLLRSALWPVLGFRKATEIAVWAGRATAVVMIVAGLGLLDFNFFIFHGGMNIMLIAIGVMVLMANLDMERVIAAEGAGMQCYSVREHAKHAKRARTFRNDMAESQTDVLYTCASCGRTEQSNPELDFRVAADGKEYCVDHLP